MTNQTLILTAEQILACAAPALGHYIKDAVAADLAANGEQSVAGLALVEMASDLRRTIDTTRRAATKAAKDAGAGPDERNATEVTISHPSVPLLARAILASRLMDDEIRTRVERFVRG